MEFWQIYLLVNLVAAVFVVWPTFRFTKRYKQELRSNSRIETNSQVYEDHYRELEQTLNRGEISQQELEGLKRDLEKTMVEENNMAADENDRPIISSFRSRLPVLAVVLVLPLLSLALYSHVGAKQDWEIYQLALDRVKAPIEQKPSLTKELVASLQDRLEQKPENLQNWYLLASTSVDSNDFEEAVRAYREVLKAQPDAALVKAELAQALFLRAGSAVTPEVRKQVQEVLAIAPNIPTALGLAGIDAYNSGSYQLAIEYWDKALVQMDPASSSYSVLKGGIERAKAALEKTGEKISDTSTAVSGPKLTVRVAIAKGLPVNATDSVFIYARAWQGPKMPLAIKKLQVSDLPTTITLDKSMAMSPAMDITSFPQVQVVARVSSSGSAITQAGDWEAVHGPVIVASQEGTIKLTIKEQIAEKAEGSSSP